ncbi:hypothetical protein OXX59_005303 [Metschnikowia pulcherrima]
MSETQVKARFFTKEDDETLHASDAPLFVPTSLKRYGLSEVVNHLLDREDAVPFDFLIDGVLLRTSLDEYLTRHGLSAEATLSIEYTRAVLPPSFLASYNDEDWVSSIDTINQSSKAVTAQRGAELAAPQILAGSYDGVVRSYNMSGQVETQYVGHQAAVRAVKWVYANRIVSAGNDRQIRLWKTKGASAGAGDDDDGDDETENARTLAVLDAHKAPVVALAVNQQSQRILSAGADGVVGLWSTVPKDMHVVEPWAGESSGAGNSSAAKKRRKMALRDSGVKHRAPLALLESHSQPVEGVIFDEFDSSVAYSVSQDHTVKTWDLVTSRCVDTRSTGYALLSVLQLPAVNLIASGSSARHINLHDPRTHAGATDLHVTKFTGHTNFVVDLAACPTKDTMFASASHDGTVKVWDVRADKCMYTVTRESKSGKVFGVAWDKEIGIVSGGEDKKVQINSSPAQS